MRALFLALLLTACGSDRSEPAPTPAAPEPEEETPPETEEADAPPEPTPGALSHERPPPQTDEQRAAGTRGRRARRLARAHLRAGRTEEAVASFRTAAELLQTPSIHCELGWALFRLERPDEARRELEDGVHLLEALPRPRDRDRNTLGA